MTYKIFTTILLHYHYIKFIRFGVIYKCKVFGYKIDIQVIDKTTGMPYTTQYIILLLVEISVIDVLTRAYFKGVVSYV